MIAYNCLSKSLSHRTSWCWGLWSNQPQSLIIITLKQLDQICPYFYMPANIDTLARDSGSLMSVEVYPNRIVISPNVNGTLTPDSDFRLLPIDTFGTQPTKEHNVQYAPIIWAKLDKFSLHSKAISTIFARTLRFCEWTKKCETWIYYHRASSWRCTTED